MKPFFLLIFSLFFTLGLSAQVGLSANIISAQADDWKSKDQQNGESSLELPGNGWQAAIDYRFGLRNYRIDFLPTLALSFQKASSGLSITPFDTKTMGAHFLFNTNIYLLDLEGDCDCPTWSKEGPTLQKGLYIQLSPGVSYFDYKIDNGIQEYASNDLAFSVGGGIGFDIGFSDFYTLTLFGTARYFPKTTWDDLEKEPLVVLNDVQAESNLWHFGAGIRFGVQL